MVLVSWVGLWSRAGLETVGYKYGSYAHKYRRF